MSSTNPPPDESTLREARPSSPNIPPLNPGFLDVVLPHLDEEFLLKSITKNGDKEEMKAKLVAIQAEAYKTFPYPCISSFLFLGTWAEKNKLYPQILEAGKKGDATFLEIGCCMGTDARKLVRDGYPASHVLGSDLRQEYIDLGHKLFNDADSCPVNFFADDVFSIPTSSTIISDIPLNEVTKLSQLQGRITHLYAAGLFHLFSKETQEELAKRVVVLMERKPGTIVFGMNQGAEVEGPVQDASLKDPRYLHTPASFTALWNSAFAEVVGEDRVKVDVDTSDHGQEGLVVLYWSVELV